MRHLHRSSTTLAIAVLGIMLLACNREQRSTTDSAAGVVATDIRAAFSVLDVDMGRHVDAARQVTDKTDDFASTDTIYASVHTSGTASQGVVVGRWTFQDGTLLNERADTVTTAGDAHTVFYIAKPAGLAGGKYTFDVLVDGQKVRSKDITVK